MMGRKEPRDAAEGIVRTLRAGGHVAYFAGGCVRDELLGLRPKDYDVATDATPERVAGLFRSVREVGKAFGVMLVRSAGVTVEVSTFRREHGYSDKRRPDAVSFCDAESDAHRRDFTINALFIDPLEREAGSPVAGRVIDHVAGLKDMRAGVLRAVGDPEARLAEDHLRALRAVRFAARLGFRIETATAGAIASHARELAGVSRERIGDELRMMLGAPSRAAAAALLHDLGLDGPVLDEVAQGARRLPVLGTLGAGAGFPLALAAWAIDRAWAGSRAAEIEAGAPELLGRWRAALCLSNDERAEMAGFLEGLAHLEVRWRGSGRARKKRAGAAPWFAGALALLGARSPSLAREIEEETAGLAMEPGGLAPAPWVTGDALIGAGLTPGPRFRGWLETLYDAQLEGRIRDAGEALLMARKLAEGGSLQGC